MRDLLRPTMSLAPVAKPFKRPILQEQFIKRFIKLRDQMCELNYKGTKIEIGVKLGTKSAILPKKMKPLQGTTQTLTRGSQCPILTVNVQIGLSRSILQGFIKLETKFVD